MNRRKQLLTTTITVLAIALLAAIPAAVLASGQEQNKQTVDPLIPSPATTDVAQPNAVSVEGRAVPADIAQRAEAGDFDAQMAKYAWENNEGVLQLKDGTYIIKQPDRIPDQISYPPRHYPPLPAEDRLSKYDMSVEIPAHLAPGEYDVFLDTLFNGKGLWIQKGIDGYLHVSPD